MNVPKASIIRRKPIRIAFDITQVRRVKTADGIECRIVDGYCYVNAMVGDGWDLTRASMVAATEKYNRWGAVREMHQPSAVGNASGIVRILNEQDEEEDVSLGVFWDEKGATCRSLAVDPTAILKLDTGVYRAYSVGVAPTVVRGNQVIECEWVENSYVDRPADPDATFTLIRAEGIDLDAEVEVLQILTRSESFADHIPMLQNWSMDAVVYDACYELMDCLYDAIRANDRAGDVPLAVQSIDEFAAYLKGVFEAGGPGLARAETLLEVARQRLSPESAQALTRVTTLEGDLTRLTQRAESAEAELKTVRADLAAKTNRVAELEALPDPRQELPYRTAERTLVSASPEVSEEATTLRTKLDAAIARSKEAGVSDKERMELATTISSTRQKLQQLGEIA